MPTTIKPKRAYCSGCVHSTPNNQFLKGTCPFCRRNPYIGKLTAKYLADCREGKVK